MGWLEWMKFITESKREHKRGKKRKEKKRKERKRE